MNLDHPQKLSCDLQAPHRAPKVSVLVRTMGRSSLAKAVKSVRNQRYKDWELLVVNASGKPLLPLPPEEAATLTRLIEPGYPLDRASAANILLDSAAGELAIFLDDDDWLLEEHLAKLVQLLELDKTLVAAYSDVECLTAAGTASQKTAHVFERDFDAATLQLQNYLPIHAVMFRMDSVRMTPSSSFLPALQLFEDWDFWLQLAAKGLFRRVPGISAIYALNSEAGSGHAEAANVQRQAMLSVLATRQLQRWQAADVTGLILNESARTNQLNHEQQVAELARQHAARLELRLTEVESTHTSQLHHEQQVAGLAQQHAARLELLFAKMESTHASQLQHEHQVAELAQQHAARLELLFAKMESTHTIQLNHEQQVAELAQQHAARLELRLTEVASTHTRQLNHEQQVAELAQQHAARLELRLTEVESTHTSQLHHEHQVAELARQQAARLELRLTDGERNLDTLQAYSLMQQAEINKLGDVRLQHLGQLDAIQQSRSWRLTKPLRGASRFLDQLPARLPMRFARNVYRAVAGELTRNGVMGFARRTPYYLRHHRTYLALLRSRPSAMEANAFAASPPELRNIRLHPDLSGGGPTIDAKVSVIIPTLNAGPEFTWMLRKLRAQCAVRELEIVVVDSGSRDTTVQVARHAGAKVIEIPPEEFSHSHARNLGADHATGDYVLFMVQDAYPIGNYWLYGMLRYLLDHADQGLVAASCAEYSRSDSDMMYDSMINTHYRFLGCLEYDRIGEYCGDDHMSLRSRGQLSDVSCLISRDCFQQFRYRGNYAEDLDLGIRLIQSGKRVAMLASVKVIHSHNRPAYYYLKRSFVDVVFLVGLFDDFTVPRCESLPGLLAGIESTAVHISQWLRQLETEASQLTLGDQLDAWIRESRQTFSLVREGHVSRLGDDRLDEFIATMSKRYLGTAAAVLDASARDEARHFSDSFLARLDHFKGFAADVYGEQDAVLRHELGDVVRKTFASAAGSALAFYCLNHKNPDDAAHGTAELIRSELEAGV